MVLEDWNQLQAPETPGGFDCSIAVGWVTYFERSGIARWRHPRLRYAYRAPAHFVERMVTRGARLASLSFDEHLDAEVLNARAPDADLLYLVTHGGQGSAGYQTALTNGDWRLAGSHLGQKGPTVAVFDTCDLVDRSSRTWRDFWSSGTVGRRLRLVLGFSSQATVSPLTSRRGDAFAQLILAGRPFAEAWLSAATGTIWPALDHPIVIALGDDEDDARKVARTASLHDLPEPRTTDRPHVYALPEED